jgi:hypothetical protein
MTKRISSERTEDKRDDTGKEEFDDESKTTTVRLKSYWKSARMERESCFELKGVGVLTCQIQALKGWKFLKVGGVRLRILRREGERGKEGERERGMRKGIDAENCSSLKEIDNGC